MGITISSRSPAMAYSEGGFWVGTYDEFGRRCWLNKASGQRTYQFLGGRPMTTSMSPYPEQHRPVPTLWAHGMQAPTQQAYLAPMPPDGYGGGGALVSYQGRYDIGIPSAIPTGDGRMAHRPQKYYLRPSDDRSWMWNH